MRETLEFSARLRLSSTMTAAMQAARIDSVLSDLHLEKCSSTLAGDAASRGISGGERKRLSIALELLTEPELIICDEPTRYLVQGYGLLMAEC